MSAVFSLSTVVPTPFIPYSFCQQPQNRDHIYKRELLISSLDNINIVKAKIIFNLFLTRVSIVHADFDLLTPPKEELYKKKKKKPRANLLIKTRRLFNIILYSYIITRDCSWILVFLF